MSYAVTLLCVSPSLAWALSEDTSRVNPNQLVLEVVANEVKAANSDQSHWMYRRYHEEPGKSVVKECVEARAGLICRVTEMNGYALTADEQQKENERIKALVNDPDEERKQQKSRRQDSENALEMLKMLPDAFTYQYDGKVGELVKLKFEPNPSFRPAHRHAKVLHEMAGFMLIDPKEKRLVEIDGRLVKDVDFGFGLLGHLYKGGTFQVKQSNIGDDHWEITLLDVNIRGKALFFKTINAQQHEVTDCFKRVPDNLTLMQAASMLDSPASQANAHPGAQ